MCTYCFNQRTLENAYGAMARCPVCRKKVSAKPGDAERSMAAAEQVISLDTGSKAFREDVANDELLDSFYRGVISPHEMVNRMIALKRITEGRVAAAFAAAEVDSDEHESNLGIG